MHVLNLQELLRPYEVAFNGALVEQNQPRNEGTSFSHYIGAISSIWMGAVQENTLDNASIRPWEVDTSVTLLSLAAVPS